MSCFIYFFFFFFQAEDGIRDLTVTGVQTCALPISNTHAVCRLPSSSLGVGLLVKVMWAPSGDQCGSLTVKSPLVICFSSRSEERRVGKECRSRWSPYH